MIRLSANLCFLFAELPFLDRFAAAREAGFEAVEFTFLYDMPPGAIAQQCRQHRLKPVLLNAPAGNLPMGECGVAALPGREAELREGFELALRYSDLIGTRHIHVLAGNVPPGSSRAGIQRAYVENLRWAADRAAEFDKIVTIEPLNARDRPDYMLRTTRQAVDIIARTGRADVRLQLDIYHCALTEPRIWAELPALLPLVAHVQIAGVPRRDEPDHGILDYQRFLSTLDAAAYDGHVGCEYLPRAGTAQGLGWAAPYLRRSASEHARREG